VSDTEAYTVQSITEDVWHFDMGVQGGQLSVARDSLLIASTADTDTNNSGFFLETGPIVDQSFAGGASTATSSTMYVGGSDYSLLFDATQPAVTATANAEGRYDLEYVGFGQATLDTSVSPTVLTEAYF